MQVGVDGMLWGSCVCGWYWCEGVLVAAFVAVVAAIVVGGAAPSAERRLSGKCGPSVPEHSGRHITSAEFGVFFRSRSALHQHGQAGGGGRHDYCGPDTNGSP